MSIDRVSRRAALKYGGIIALAAQGTLSFPGFAVPPVIKGYGTDPNLLTRPVTWPKTLSPSELKSFAALCEIILPTAPPHPSAAAVNVQDFLDEWLSAPYPQMQADGKVILSGLNALDQAMQRRQKMSFASAAAAQQALIFDQLCNEKATQPFARRLIELVCAGYYTTREGHAAIGYVGYVGNVALERFPPPSPEIVQHFEKALSELPQPPQSGAT